MSRDAHTVERPWAVHVERTSPDVARVELTGAWRNADQVPDSSEVWREIETDPSVRRLVFDASRVTEWDSGLVTFARRLLEDARTRGIDSDRAGLPDGVQRLLHLAEAVPQRQTSRGSAQAPWLARIGDWATTYWAQTLAGIDRKSTRLNSSHLGISYAVF